MPIVRFQNDEKQMCDKSDDDNSDESSSEADDNLFLEFDSDSDSSDKEM